MLLPEAHEEELLYNRIFVFATNNGLVILYDLRSVRWGVLCMRVSKLQFCRRGASLHIGCRYPSCDILKDEEHMTSKEMHHYLNRFQELVPSDVRHQLAVFVLALWCFLSTLVNSSSNIGTRTLCPLQSHRLSRPQKRLTKHPSATSCTRPSVFAPYILSSSYPPTRSAPLPPGLQPSQTLSPRVALLCLFQLDRLPDRGLGRSLELDKE